MEPVWLRSCRAGADGHWLGAPEQSSASSQTVPRSPRCTPRIATMPDSRTVPALNRRLFLRVAVADPLRTSCRNANGTYELPKTRTLVEPSLAICTRLTGWRDHKRGQSGAALAVRYPELHLPGVGDAGFEQPGKRKCLSSRRHRFPSSTLAWAGRHRRRTGCRTRRRRR
jgi:hypothetical protein